MARKAKRSKGFSLFKLFGGKGGKGRRGKMGGKGWLAAGGIAAVAAVLMGRKTKTASTGETIQSCEAIKNAAVKGGETIAVANYRILSERRSGMDYAEAQGYEGGELSFAVPRDGVFTRNFVKDGGKLYAEIR